MAVVLLEETKIVASTYNVFVNDVFVKHLLPLLKPAMERCVAADGFIKYYGLEEMLFADALDNTSLLGANTCTNIFICVWKTHLA